MNISIVNSLPIDERNEAIISAALNSPDIFIIKNKKCLNDFFKELVKRTIRTDAEFNKEELESYKNKIQITKNNINIELPNYALTYKTAHDILTSLYMLTFDNEISCLIEKLNKPENDIDLIRKSLKDNIEIKLVNPFVEEIDKQEIKRLIYKTKTTIEIKNDIILDYLDNINQDILDKYTSPYDGTRPFVSCGICIIDMDFCIDVQEAKAIIKSSKKCILLGNSIDDEYIRLANELYEKDGIVRVFDINEKHIIEKSWLLQETNFKPMINTHEDFRELYHKDIDILYWRLSEKEDKRPLSTAGRKLVIMEKEGKRTLSAAISKANKKLVIIGNPEKLEDNSPLWDFYYECKEAKNE